MNNIKICPYCNNEIHAQATKCKYCKRWLDETALKKRKFLDTALLCWFLGGVGVHRFYTGYYGIGLFQLFTIGGFVIWQYIDLFSICLGKYRDVNGLPLENYNRKTGIIILSVVLTLTLLAILFLLLIVGLIGLYIAKASGRL